MVPNAALRFRPTEAMMAEMRAYRMARPGGRVDDAGRDRRAGDRTGGGGARRRQPPVAASGAEGGRARPPGSSGGWRSVDGRRRLDRRRGGGGLRHGRKTRGCAPTAAPASGTSTTRQAGDARCAPGSPTARAPSQRRGLNEGMQVIIGTVQTAEQTAPARQPVPGAAGGGRPAPRPGRVLIGASMNGTARRQPIIRLEGVTRVYQMGDNEVHALRGVDLTVERGELVAIMGASGSGKSTLMNILGCLDMPTAGTYCLDGVAVERPEPQRSSPTCATRSSASSSRASTCWRAPARWRTSSCRCSTTAPALARNARAGRDAALERVGLGERLDHQPERAVGRPAAARRHRARARHGAALLLADEPTGNLDSRTSVEVMALFQELNDQGITVVLVTHEPDVAQYAKRIIEMRDGRILRDHPVEDRHSAADDLREIADPEARGGGGA